MVSEKAADARASCGQAYGLNSSQSHWRRDSLDNFGEFILIEPSSNFPVARFPYSMTAEEVIEHCKD
jgi:hypothetical protein